MSSLSLSTIFCHDRATAAITTTESSAVSPESKNHWYCSPRHRAREKTEEKKLQLVVAAAAAADLLLLLLSFFFLPPPFVLP